MAQFFWPPQSGSGPIQFIENGTVTNVSQDTGTPANSTPLPVTVLSPSGVPINPQDVFVQNTLFTLAYNEIDITSYDANNNPLIVVTKLSGTTQQTATLTYDGSGRLTSVVRTP